MSSRWQEAMRRHAAQSLEFCEEAISIHTKGVTAMKKSHPVVRAAITSLVALGLGSLATATYAADDHSGDEQCAGVIKAGKNDCATSMNDCHGHVKADSSPMAWIYVPKGTCERIIGAHLVKVKEPAPKKS